MENVLLTAGITCVAGLTLLRLCQMLRWIPCEATFLGTEHAFPVPSYMGQALPIAFQLPDGKQMHAALRNYSRGDLPQTGTRMQIRYDPDDPERVEWAAAVPFLALVLAVLTAMLASVLVRALSSPEFAI